MENPAGTLSRPEIKNPEAYGPNYIERQKIDAEGVTLATDQFMEGSEEAQVAIDGIVGDHAPVIAGIRTGIDTDEDSFIIVDTRNSDTIKTPYMLITEAGGMKGIWPNKPLTIGRAHHTDRFSYTNHVSRSHFTIDLDGDTGALHVRDNESANGTYVTGHVAETEEPTEEMDAINLRGIKAEYTVSADEKDKIFHDDDVEAPHGYFMEHAVIGRESKTVKGGVYGTRSSEWVVVNTKNEKVQNVVNDTMYNLSFMPRDARPEEVLAEIERVTATYLKYDLPATEELSRPHYNKHGLIGLSEYLEAGVGVCRQQALLAGLLMESAIDRGILNGSIGVERNIDEDREAGHAWAVFKQEGKPDVIVDAAQHFIGTRVEANNRGKWRYVVSNNIG